MSYCSQCGSSVSGRFCTSCGAAVESPDEQSNTPAPASALTPVALGAASDASGASRRRKAVLVGAAIGIGILAVGGAAFMLGRSGSGTPSPSGGAAPATGTSTAARQPSITAQPSAAPATAAAPQPVATTPPKQNTAPPAADGLPEGTSYWVATTAGGVTDYFGVIRNGSTVLTSRTESGGSGTGCFSGTLSGSTLSGGFKRVTAGNGDEGVAPPRLVDVSGETLTFTDPITGDTLDTYTRTAGDPDTSTIDPSLRVCKDAMR